MAFVLTSLAPATKGWAANITGDLSACETIVAAPATGSLYLTQIVINCATAAQTVTVGAGETASSVTAPVIGPITFGAEGNFYTATFLVPIKIAATTAITADASGAGVVQIFAAGYTIL